MADEEKITGLRLLSVAVTPALANYLDDHYAMIRFQAYLWKMVVTVDYGPRSREPHPGPGDEPAPDSAVAQMNAHSQYLGEMMFCRGVNSFQHISPSC